MKHIKKILAITTLAVAAASSGWLLESQTTHEVPKTTAATETAPMKADAPQVAKTDTTVPTAANVKTEPKTDAEPAPQKPQTRVVKEFNPTRRVIEHPEYGPLVELTYEDGVKRYEPTGPGDAEP